LNVNVVIIYLSFHPRFLIWLGIRMRSIRLNGVPIHPITLHLVEIKVCEFSDKVSFHAGRSFRKDTYGLSIASLLTLFIWRCLYPHYNLVEVLTSLLCCD